VTQKVPRGDKNKADGNGCSEHKGVCWNEGEENFKQKERDRKGDDAIAIEIRARFMIEGEGATRLFITEQVRDYRLCTIKADPELVSTKDLELKRRVAGRTRLSCFVFKASSLSCII